MKVFGLRCLVFHHFMDSTSKGLFEAMGTEEKNLAKAKTSRGISAKACVAKAMTWMLDMAKALPSHEASISIVRHQGIK